MPTKPTSVPDTTPDAIRAPAVVAPVAAARRASPTIATYGRRSAAGHLPEPADDRRPDPA
jgi:hypothetical protein